MIIDQLPEVSAVQETDEIPVERGTTTYKSTLQKLKNLVASLLTKSDVGLGNVDNVRQYSADNPPILVVTVSGTTTASGALVLPFSFGSYYVVSTECTSNVNYFAFSRGDGYLTCFTVVDGHLVTAANTALTFNVYYAQR